MARKERTWFREEGRWQEYCKDLRDRAEEKYLKRKKDGKDEKESEREEETGMEDKKGGRKRWRVERVLE